MKTILSFVPDSAVPGIMILVCLAGAVASLLTCSGCAGLEIVTHTPYGSAGYRDGVLTGTPNPGPITIPVHREK